MKEFTRNRKTEQNMTYTIHGCSAVCRHSSATSTATVAVFSGENCSSTVSLKRKSISPISSPSEPSPKRVTLNSPPPSAAAIVAAVEDGPDPISPTTSSSPKRVSLNSPPPSAAAMEEGPVSISPITSPSPAFSPFSKRVSEKSPFSTTNTAAAAADAMAAPPPLPFSRFTKMQPSNTNKILRRTLSEPPIFDSFTDFCRYMNSQSPENSKNNPISVKSTLRRSISDPTTAEIILAPAPAPAPATATPALTSRTGHAETTRNKKC